MTSAIGGGEGAGHRRAGLGMNAGASDYRDSGSSRHWLAARRVHFRPGTAGQGTVAGRSRNAPTRSMDSAEQSPLSAAGVKREVTA